MNNKNISFKINELIGLDIPVNDAIEIISFATKIPYYEVRICGDKFINLEEQKIINKIISQMAKGKPLAYILGYKSFYNFLFKVNKNVLIPRQESENMIDIACDFLKNNNGITLLDLCSGSGCIGISAYLKNSVKINKLLFSDISKKAMKVCKKNLIEHKVKVDTQILNGDFLKPFFKLNIKTNILLCNPPYIDLNDQEVDESTLSYEPSLALFANNNGLEFYIQIIDNIDKIVDVNNNFLIVLEFGWKQKEELEKILIEKIGLKYKYEFFKDHFGNWRNLKITN